MIGSVVMRLSKVLVLYTGGTIGMTIKKNGALAPEANAFAEKLRTFGEFHNQHLAEKLCGGMVPEEVFAISHAEGNVNILYTVKEYDHLIDSSDISPKVWIRISSDIEKFYKEFDAFVILHGTDTMAYTASALSYMLENLTKPVIITGSQRPIFDIRNDAKENFLNALIFAASTNIIPEVCLCFSNKLLRGNRTIKTSTNSYDAFHSPNYTNLGEVDSTGFKINSEAVRNLPENRSLVVHKRLESSVVLIVFYPTLTPKMLAANLSNNVKGAVLATYGGGNIPSSKKYLSILKEAIDRGIIILNVTQCSHGPVTSIYEGGQALKEIGVLPCNDMTLEAALTKLCHILGLQMNREETLKYVRTDLRGEMKVTN